MRRVLLQPNNDAVYRSTGTAILCPFLLPAQSSGKRKRSELK